MFYVVLQGLSKRKDQDDSENRWEECQYVEWTNCINQNRRHHVPWRPVRTGEICPRNKDQSHCRSANRYRPPETAARKPRNQPTDDCCKRCDEVKFFHVI